MSITVTRRRVVVATIATLAFAVLGITAAGAAASPHANGRATLPGSVPPWAQSSRSKGAAAGSDSVGFRVYLGWRNETAAEALAKAVSNPSSSSYGHYLTPQQFRQRFAPSRSDVNSVESWLRSQGFQIDYVPQNNHYVEAEGTVAQANAAFGVTLNEYSYDGKTLRAPSSALTIPSSLASTVDGVIGLDQSAELVRPTAKPAAPPSPGFRNAPPCSTYWDQYDSTVSTTIGSTTYPALPLLPGLTDQPWKPCGYTPPQLRGAYEGGTNLTGAGQTVAIIDAYASPTILQDAQQYSATNDPGNELQSSQFRQVVAPGTFRRPQNPAQDPQGWYGEETLDVEAVHAMAPGANIVFVGAPNNYQDLDAALNHVVDRHLADVVTNSYGFIGEAVPPGYIIPYNNTLYQATIEGMSVLFSSGDYGDNSLIFGIPPQPDWSASDPWVTAVGGTSLEVGATDNYLGEFGWSTFKYSLQNGSWKPVGFIYGSGGGISNLFAEPSYQVDAGIDASGRVVPDVSMVGDPNTGMLIGQTQTFPDGAYYDQYVLGGTSLSSPLFAGMLALVNESRASASEPVIGFANPELYAAGSGAYRDIVDPSSPTTGVARNDFANGVDGSDGVATSLRLLGWEGQSIHAKPGYDDMTGLGTPNGTSFFDALTP